MDNPNENQITNKMNFIETLISEVAKRPLLWDKRDDGYKNREAMDLQWECIANMLNRDKDFVKQKWRNLRDQFQRETKKVKVPFGKPIKPYIEYYRGKWIYFERMLFLKNRNFLRLFSENTNNSTFSTTEDMEISENDIKEELIVFVDDDLAEHMNNINSESDFEREQSTTSSVEEIPTIPKVEITEVEAIEEKDNQLSGDASMSTDRRKRKTSDSGNELAAPVKNKRQSETETVSVEDQCDIDDDLHFVKSLVPYLRRLPPLRKLIVRNEIQNLLIRESLCETCKFGSVTSHCLHHS